MSKFEKAWMETEEEDLCGAAVLAFHSLAELAERLATGGAGETVVISDGVSRLAKRAAAFAAKNPVPSPQPDPLARLAIEVAHLRELEAVKIEERKERATWLAAKCREESSNAAMRLASLLEKRQFETAVCEAQGMVEAERDGRKRAEALASERQRILNESFSNLATKEDVAKVGAVAAATEKTVADGVDRMEELHGKALGAIDEVRKEYVKRIFDAYLKGRNLTAEDADLIRVCREAGEGEEHITMEEAGSRLKKPHGKHWVSDHYHKLVGPRTGWGFQSMAAAVKSAGSYNPEALGHNPQK